MGNLSQRKIALREANAVVRRIQQRRVAVMDRSRSREQKTRRHIRFLFNTNRYVKLRDLSIQISSRRRRRRSVLSELSADWHTGQSLVYELENKDSNLETITAELDALISKYPRLGLKHRFSSGKLSDLVRNKGDVKSAA